jgi:hypothetical protein
MHLELEKYGKLLVVDNIFEIVQHAGHNAKGVADITNK